MFFEDAQLISRMYFTKHGFTMGVSFLVQGSGFSGSGFKGLRVQMFPPLFSCYLTFEPLNVEPLNPKECDHRHYGFCNIFMGHDTSIKPLRPHLT